MTKKRKKELSKTAKILRNTAEKNPAAIIMRGLKSGVCEAEINLRLERYYKKLKS